MFNEKNIILFNQIFLSPFLNNITRLYPQQAYKIFYLAYKIFFFNVKTNNVCNQTKNEGLASTTEELLFLFFS